MATSLQKSLIKKQKAKKLKAKKKMKMSKSGISSGKKVKGLYK